MSIIKFLLIVGNAVFGYFAIVRGDWGIGAINFVIAFYLTSTINVEVINKNKKPRRVTKKSAH